SRSATAVASPCARADTVSASPFTSTSGTDFTSGTGRPTLTPVKIDVFPHILPPRYFERMLAAAPPGMALQKRMSGIPVLVDLDLRLAVMDRYEGYVQVLTLANPPIEIVAGPDLSPELARLANDEMARVVGKRPERFPGFLGAPP